MDPAVVDSTEFGLLWSTKFNNLEKFYAKPLVYTPLAGGPQIVFIASSQNWIRTMNAKTGEPLNARQVHTPFLQAEIGCTDIPDTIGIIGTPVIDPTSDIAYFFSKTYIPNFRIEGNTGIFNGVYYFHGVNVNTLQDVFPPILIDGSQSDNAPAKYFVGGVILQRPALTQIGSVVYGGFGGHCDLFNYTGVVIGVDINQRKVVANFAVESGPLVPQTNIYNENGGGGEGGIWMSGMALATDGANRLFWVSGNGVGHENQGVPASGSSGCRTLGEAAVNLAVGAGGKLSLTDYFQPYDYQGMDGGDQDFGSGGIALLDPGTFSGTGVSKIAVTSGKNGKIYILNANNLGGYKLGPGQTDGVIQTIVTNKAVFGGVGSYPLEGGYIYSTPVGYPTYVYKLGHNGAGIPVFSQVGQTPEKSAGRVGVGIPVITTFQGKAGTAILWMCDPDAGLRAWYAVPGDDGKLKRINIPQVNGLNKFQRPAFGDSRLYVTDATGTLYCLGSPVNLPLNCTSPVNFGSVSLGASASQIVSCKANIPITKISSITVGDLHFEVNPGDLPQGPVAKGATFSFPVKWNLERTTVTNAQNASYGNTAPGIKSTALTLQTVNGVEGYSAKFPISLTGTEVSAKPFIVVAPITVDYSGIVITDPKNIPTNSLPFVISNAGASPLTITGYAFTNDELEDDDIDYTNVTFAQTPYSLGKGFTSPNLPPVGTAIPGGGQISVDSTFTPTEVGSYYSYFFVFSNGGQAYTILEGSASTAPIANFSISTREGGWLPEQSIVMDFGSVAPGTTSSLKIRICNEGGSVLQISKSKPPNGVFRPEDPTSLHESQDIPVNDCAYATVLFVTNAEQPNMPDQTFTNTWTLNTDDINFGVHEVQIRGTVVSRKVGPQNSTGQPIYSYLGCYHEIKPGGRLLPNQQYADQQNSNDRCQEKCNTGKYIFSGTEYQIECYCGNTSPPNLYKSDETYCNYACSGDPSETCGGRQTGAGGYISIYYDSTRFTPSLNDSTGTGTVGGGPQTVNQSGDYSYIGCYSEVAGGRALSGKTPAAPATGTTVESCAAACQGFQYFGVEYSNECYCGNTINAGSTKVAGTSVTETKCNMACGGNSTEYCGGPSRINMYQKGATTSTSSSTASSNLANGVASTASSSSSPFSLTSTNTSSTSISRSSTSSPTSPTLSTFYATTSSTVTTPPTYLPTPSSLYNGWSYLGCANETLPRALPAATYTNTTNMTLSTCHSFCSSSTNNYGLAGLENGQDCYCANGLQSYSAVGFTGCNTPCKGNSSEICGGASRLSVWNSTSSIPPTTVKQVGTYLFQGCYPELAKGRLMAGASFSNRTGMTVERCVNFCAATGAQYAGVEFASECYCGKPPPSGYLSVDASRCNLVCTGNSREFCGAKNVLNIYANTPGSVGANGTARTVNEKNEATIKAGRILKMKMKRAMRARGLRSRFQRRREQ
ncbi:MAG: hypothetical protein Q9223_002519 [Gallowayella weberi]